MKNIIFDLGNVLILFEPDKYVNQNVSDDKRERFLNTVFHSEEWLDLDRGTLSYEDAKKIFKSKLKDCDKEVENLFHDNFYGMLEPIKENVKILEKLKGKYNLYILSNFHKDSFETISSRHDFFNCFDGGIVSAFHNCIKPDEEIYRLLIEKYDLNPDETLFIDDLEKNILKAQEIGIKIIHLTDYTELEDKLKEKNII